LGFLNRVRGWEEVSQKEVSGVNRGGKSLEGALFPKKRTRKGCAGRDVGFTKSHGTSSPSSIVGSHQFLNEKKVTKIGGEQATSDAFAFEKKEQTNFSNRKIWVAHKPD